MLIGTRGRRWWQGSILSVWCFSPWSQFSWGLWSWERAPDRRKSLCFYNTIMFCWWTNNNLPCIGPLFTGFACSTSNFNILPSNHTSVPNKEIGGCGCLKFIWDDVNENTLSSPPQYFLLHRRSLTGTLRVSPLLNYPEIWQLCCPLKRNTQVWKSLIVTSQRANTQASQVLATFEIILFSSCSKQV